jgi:hypothetical protein
MGIQAGTRSAQKISLGVDYRSFMTIPDPMEGAGVTGLGFGTGGFFFRVLKAAGTQTPHIIATGVSISLPESS